MRDGYLAAQLARAGIERRFAIDIGSVVAGVRPMGLLHCEYEKVQGVESVLHEFQLTKLAGRRLFRSQDRLSRESVLSVTPNSNSDDWYEIWYGQKLPQGVSPEQLFSETGLFLGYPQCCRDAMNSDGCLATLYRRYLQEDRKRNWRINRLAALFHPTILMPDFFPCSLSCREAVSFASAIQSASGGFLGQEDVSSATQAMKAPLTVIGDAIFSWPAWSISDGRLEVRADSSLKESLKNVANALSGTDGNYAILLSFEHLDGAASCKQLSELRILRTNGEVTDLPLEVDYCAQAQRPSAEQATS